MNQSVPNWSMENILAPTEKKSLGVDNNELVELLWRDGQVVQQSQAHRKQGSGHNDAGQKRKLDHPLRGGQSFTNLSSLIDEDETPSWMQFPLDDSLCGDFCSSFFSELSNPNPVEKERAVKHFGSILEETNVLTNHGASRVQQPVFRQPGNLAKPSRDPNFGGLGRAGNFPHFSRTIKAEIPSSDVPTRGPAPVFAANGGDTGESSVMTIGSSHCGSNQVNEASIGIRSTNNKEITRKVFPRSERGLTDTLETTITSSSGGSGGSYTETEKQSLSLKRHKRKGREADESESQSEGAEFESAGANKAPQQSGSTRRSRAAEVHNLSERRRRDRINEKMKALQELIPHCNKSDKASMLDEAIEYLKSLQLQVQMMWMGGGMAPMMFPGVQHYMSRMSMGMGTHPALPSIHSPIQLPRVPPLNQSMSPALLPNQPAMCSPVLNGVNFQNRMQNCDFTQPYAQHRGFNHIQAPQSMNMYGYGSQIPQQSPDIRLSSNSAVPSQEGALAANKPNSKLG